MSYPGDGYSYLQSRSTQSRTDIGPHQLDERIPLVDLHAQSQGDDCGAIPDEWCRRLRFSPSGDCQKDTAPESGDVMLMHSGDEVHVRVGTHWCSAGSDGDAFYRALLAGLRQVHPDSLRLEDVIDSTRTPIATQVDLMENNGGHPMAGSARLRSIFNPGQWDCAYEEQIAAAATKSELWSGGTQGLWIGWREPANADNTSAGLVQSISAWIAEASTQAVTALKDLWDSPGSSWLSEADLQKRWEIRYDEIIESLRSFPGWSKWRLQEQGEIIDCVLQGTAPLSGQETRRQIRMLGRTVQCQSEEDTRKILLGWWIVPESSPHQAVHAEAAHLRSLVLEAALNYAKFTVPDPKEILRMHENCTLKDVYCSVARIDMLRAGSQDPRDIAKAVVMWQSEWMSGTSFKLREPGWKAVGLEFIAQSGLADLNASFQKAAAASGDEKTVDAERADDQLLENVIPVSHAMTEDMRVIGQQWEAAVHLSQPQDTSGRVDDQSAPHVSRNRRTAGNEDTPPEVEQEYGNPVTCRRGGQVKLDDVMQGDDKDFVRDFRARFDKGGAVHISQSGSASEVLDALHLNTSTVENNGFSPVVKVGKIRKKITGICTVNGGLQRIFEGTISLEIKQAHASDWGEPGSIRVQLAFDEGVDLEQVRSGLFNDLAKAQDTAANNYCQRNEWTVHNDSQTVLPAQIRLGMQSVLDLDAIRGGILDVGLTDIIVKKQHRSTPVILNQENMKVDKGYYRNGEPYFSLTESKDVSTLRLRQARRADFRIGKCEVPHYVDLKFREKDWGGPDGASRTVLRELVLNTRRDAETYRRQAEEPDITPASATEIGRNVFDFEFSLASRDSTRTMYWAPGMKLILPAGAKGNLLLRKMDGGAVESAYPLDLCGLMRDGPLVTHDSQSTASRLLLSGENVSVSLVDKDPDFADALKKAFDDAIARCQPSGQVTDTFQGRNAETERGTSGGPENAVLHASLREQTASRSQWEVNVAGESGETGDRDRPSSPKRPSVSIIESRKSPHVTITIKVEEPADSIKGKDEDDDDFRETKVVDEPDRRSKTADEENKPGGANEEPADSDKKTDLVGAAAFSLAAAAMPVVGASGLSFVKGAVSLPGVAGVTGVVNAHVETPGDVAGSGGATDDRTSAAAIVPPVVEDEFSPPPDIDERDYERLESRSGSDETGRPGSPAGSGYSTRSASLTSLLSDDDSTFSTSSFSEAPSSSGTEWTSPFQGESPETVTWGTLSSLNTEEMLGPLEPDWNPQFSAWPEAIENGSSIVAKRVALGTCNFFIAAGTLLGSCSMVDGVITLGQEGQAFGGAIVGATNVVETLEAAEVIQELTPGKTYVLNFIQQGGGIIVVISASSALGGDAREFRDEPSFGNGVRVAMDMAVVLGAVMGLAPSAQKLGLPIEKADEFGLIGFLLNMGAAIGNVGVAGEQQKREQEELADAEQKENMEYYKSKSPWYRRP